MHAAKIRPTATLTRPRGSIPGRFHAGRARGTVVAAVAAAAADAEADDSLLRATLAGGWPNALQLPPVQTSPHRPSVPSLLNARHYVNLTAGAEALPLLRSALGASPSDGGSVRFCRITSTACEQQALAQVTLAEVADASLLMDLALGEAPVIVWDAGSRRRRRRKDDDKDDAAAADLACCPRALWYGLEFARWALHTLWFDQDNPQHPSPRSFLRGFNVKKDFERQLKAAPASVLRRLRYFSRYIPEERRLAAAAASSTKSLDTGPFALRLYGMYRGTDRDAEPEFFVGRVREATTTRGAAAGQQQQRQLDEEGARRAALEAGWRVFAGGVGHEEMAGLLKRP
jgi:hypothetical protein